MLSQHTQADQRACAFLALILPQKGPYAAFIVDKDGERKRVVFACDISELWEIIKAADTSGHTIYHACAGYKEARYDPRGTPSGQRRYGRTKRNARGAKALWLDVDAGPGKPYPDWQAAARALAEFCRLNGLPRPLIVLSGLGIHVYWALVQTLDVQTWERYARGLKALCAKLGLQADSARTADITSVLRTPGTHHRKAGIRLVQCGSLVGPYTLEQFSILLSVADEAKASRIVTEFGPFPSYLEHRPFEGLNETIRRSLSTTYKPSFAELIARRCEQIGALRDAKGNLPEPLWYACLGVLAFAEDGERLAHEWSSGDPRYTREETQQRLDRARQLSGATTCRRFHELNPKFCERCKFWRPQ